MITKDTAIILDSKNLYLYQDQDEALILDIKVVAVADVTVNVDPGLEDQISQYTQITIQSKTISTLNISFFQKNGSTEISNSRLTITNTFSDAQTLVLTISESGKCKVIPVNGSGWNDTGLKNIKALIATELSGLGDEIKDLIGDDDDGVPKSAYLKEFTIKPSGWICHSLGTIDNEVAAGKSIKLNIKIELGSTFNNEFPIYPFNKITNEEDKTKAPVAWALTQPKSGLGVMPLIPNDNVFKDYTDLTIENPDAKPPMEKKKLPTVTNNTGDYLISGRFNGANTIATAPAKDKMSVHSQGALLLHVLFSVVTPRTIYFKINNPYAPFIKILFYSFQIQSFYNGALKYFYAPKYKTVVFKQNSFDAKGLFINMPPVVAGAAKKCPIQNIYQWSKIDALSGIADKFNDNGEMPDEEESINTDNHMERKEMKADATEIFIGPKDCDFRYFTDATIFPVAGTMPLLKTADKAFFTTPDEKSIILPKQGDQESEADLAKRNPKPSFIKMDKTYNVLPLGTQSAFKDENAIFDVIDKDTLLLTPVVDMNFAMQTTPKDPIKNVEKIALTINNNMIFVIGKTFMQKILDGKFKAFDLIFNQKQFWLTIVLKKNALTLVKDGMTLTNLFPQFAASQAIIANELTKIKVGLVTDTNTVNDMRITFKLSLKTKANPDKTQIAKTPLIIDSVDKVASIKPVAFTLNADKITTAEFEVTILEAVLKDKLAEIGIEFADNIL